MHKFHPIWLSSQFVLNLDLHGHFNLTRNSFAMKTGLVSNLSNFTIIKYILTTIKSHCRTPALTLPPPHKNLETSSHTILIHFSFFYFVWLSPSWQKKRKITHFPSFRYVLCRLFKNNKRAINNNTQFAPLQSLRLKVLNCGFAKHYCTSIHRCDYAAINVITAE